MKNRYPCPCCGYYVFDESPGSFSFCPICGWQDDIIDLEEMYEPMGPNRIFLFDAQRNFREFGAAEERLKESVRQPNQDDIRDPKWRPLNKDIDRPHALQNLRDSEIYYWNWIKEVRG